MTKKNWLILIIFCLFLFSLAAWKSSYVKFGNLNFLKKGDSSPNIILISIDTLRADHMECYGNPLPVSPELNRLSKRGVLCKSVISQAPWTVPSHWSMFTGCYVSHHGYMCYQHDIRKDLKPIAELLMEKGYYTAAFTGGGTLSPSFGFSKGFKIYETPSINLVDNIPRAMQFIEKRSSEKTRPFFLFIHGFDVHTPYSPINPFDKMFIDDYDYKKIDISAIPNYAVSNRELSDNLGLYLSLYDGCIRQVDMRIGELIRLLQEKNIWDNTIVIITSDHGEEFMDHGAFNHIWVSLYESAVHVPMIIIGKSIPKGVIIDHPVQVIDIFAWLVHKLNINYPENKYDGTNFLKMDGGNNKQFAISENILYRNFISTPMTIRFVDNEIGYWLSTVKPFEDKSSLDNAIHKEFGFRIEHPTENTYVASNGVMIYQIRKCDTPGKACMLCADVPFIDFKAEVKNVFFHQQKLRESPSKDKHLPEWNEIQIDNCLFRLPEGFDVIRSANEKCIRTARWKLVYEMSTQKSRLYDLESDPGEYIDVSELHENVVKKLLALLQKNTQRYPFKDIDHEIDKTDSNTLEELKALGYISNSDE